MKKKTGIMKVLYDKTFILLLITIALMLFFRILNPHYFTNNNIRTLLADVNIIGILAVGLACLFISGQIDLSPGGVGCMGAILLAIMIGQWGLPWPAALLLTIVFGIVAGLVTSFFVNVFNISAFIATLAMTTVYQGLVQVVSNNMALPVIDEGFAKLGSFIGSTPIPVTFVIMTCLFIIYGLILAKTKFGRKVYICGGNPNAARLAGINTKKMHTIFFVNNSMLAALGGALLVARLRSANTLAMFGTEFESITAIVLGGIAFTGGKGNMAGAFVGLMLLAVFKNGLKGLGVPAFWQVVAQGLIFIAALSVDFLRERSLEKSLKAKI